MSCLVILDTETTGLSSKEHRIIEVGAIKLMNRRFTGESFHSYINPQRPVDAGAMRVHGLTDAFLADKPFFKQVAHDFLAFIKNATLVIHNAPFDLGFLDKEYKILSKKHCPLQDNHPIIDTLLLARKKHPGQKNNLDALCKRYEVDTQHRHYHGALLDAELLAEVYLALTREQKHFLLDNVPSTITATQNIPLSSSSKNLIMTTPSANEWERHQNYLEMFSK
jgi:DNA polymerase III subunit epsilon